MKVEIIRLSKMNKGKTVALFDVLIEDSLVIKNCRLIKGETSFIAPPSKKVEGGKYDGKYFSEGWSFHFEAKEMATGAKKLHDDIMAAVKVAYKNAPEAKKNTPAKEEDTPW